MQKIGRNTVIELDALDESIIQHLSRDARLSMTELARRVGLSKTPVLARVRRLEEAGLITGYHATLSWPKLGLGCVTFVQVRLTDTREKALKAFNAAVVGLPEVEECHMIASGFDYLLKVRTRDVASYREVMGEKLSELPHVASTSSYVALEVVKES
ncbi:Lrp/AsnC family transcriptional regulator [Oceanicola sp. 502str15]|uniref:Lrp/AsnC family transcriptional regulator n=1 Tax=Rhodobacterales TaxID=204455 RepID=UPI003531D05A